MTCTFLPMPLVHELTIALKNERRVLKFSNLVYTIALALRQELQKFGFP